MSFYIRSETDDQDRKVITAYTNECWETWIARVTLIGDRPWITFNGPIADPRTVNVYVEVLRWAKQFTRRTNGVLAFDLTWAAQPLEHHCAKKVTGWGSKRG